MQFMEDIVEDLVEKIVPILVPQIMEDTVQQIVAFGKREGVPAHADRRGADCGLPGATRSGRSFFLLSVPRLHRRGSG